MALRKPLLVSMVEDLPGVMGLRSGVSRHRTPRGWAAVAEAANCGRLYQGADSGGGLSTVVPATQVDRAALCEILDRAAETCRSRWPPRRSHDGSAGGPGGGLHEASRSDMGLSHRCRWRGRRRRARRRDALSANMSETVTPWKFSVEGEAGLESDERIGAGPRWAGDRGGGEGDAAAVHGGVQAEDRARGRRAARRRARSGRCCGGRGCTPRT